MILFRRCLLACLLLLSCSTVLFAQEDGRQGSQPLDWLLIVIYAGSTIGLGAYFSRRQSTLREYFVGSGHMNPVLVGVSLFATLLSTITYLSAPGEALGKGPVHLSVVLGYPLVFLIGGYFLLPVYMKHRVTSAYELLEVRLGVEVRILGATMFLILRLVWMSLLVYLAAKAMCIMMGLDAEWIPVVVIVTGLVSVIYTTLGGLRAVVITDFLQTLLLFGGALLVIITISIQMGGFSWFPTTWQSVWDTQPIISFDPATRVTVVGSFVSFLVWYVATAGGDQTSVQRFMSTRDLTAARWAFATQLTVAAVVTLTLGVVGFALLGYFQANSCLSPADFKKHADDAFPFFISYHLPVGVSGLVVSAMFAAAMSSIDSGVNSITAVVVTDYLDRFGFSPKSEKSHLRIAQILAFAIGFIVVIGSSFMGYVPGNITAVTQKTTNLLTTPIFALFFFALFVPSARPAGVMIGAFFGTMTAVLIAFSGPIVAFLAVQLGVDPAAWFNVELITTVDPVTNETSVTAPDPISFQWIGPMALAVNILVGYFASRVIKHFASPSGKS